MMSENISRLIASLLLGGCVALCGYQLYGVELRTGASQNLPFNLAGLPLPIWSGGALLAVENSRSALPVLRASDRQGREVLRFPFTIPGARHIETYSFRFARGFDGSVVIAGTAFTDDSRAGNFIAWASPEKQQQTVIRVSPFAVYAVTLAADGTIWAAGREATPDGKEAPDHSIIRRYDRNGKALAPLIPRSSVKLEGRLRHPAEYSYLFSSSDRVGWYSEAMNAYIEFSPDGSELNRFSAVPHQPDTRILGFGLCEDGQVFASGETFGKEGGVTAWRIYRLNRRAGDWQVVHEKRSAGMIYGCDGRQLVTSSDGVSLTWLETAAVK